MSDKRHSRRAVLALAGGSLVAGCVASSGPSESNGSATPSDAAGGTPRVPSVDEASWPQVGRESNHTGYNPTMDATKPSERWAVDLDGPLTTPTVVGDTVYVSRGAPTDGAPAATVEAFALDSGEKLWSKDLDTEFRFGAPYSDLRPAFHDGTLYLTLGKEVVALDPATREKRWSTSLNTFVQDSPVVTDDSVYVRAEDLVCFDENGDERWRFGPEDTPITSLPGVADETAYLLTIGGLVALDTDDGTERWQTETNGLSSTPVVAKDGSVIHAGHDTVVAVDSDGTRLWKASRDGGAVVHPAVANGTVFVAGLKGTIAAYALASGERRWETTVDADAEQQATIPTVTKGAVHMVRVGDGSATVRAFDWKTGEVQWTLSRQATRARGPIPAHATYLLSTSRTPQKQRNEGTIAEGQDTESTLYAFSP